MGTTDFKHVSVTDILRSVWQPATTRHVDIFGDTIQTIYSSQWAWHQAQSCLRENDIDFAASTSGGDYCIDIDRCAPLIHMMERRDDKDFTSQVLKQALTLRRADIFYQNGAVCIDGVPSWYSVARLARLIEHASDIGLMKKTGDEIKEFKDFLQIHGDVSGILQWMAREGIRVRNAPKLGAAATARSTDIFSMATYAAGEGEIDPQQVPGYQDREARKPAMTKAEAEAARRAEKGEDERSPG